MATRRDPDRVCVERERDPDADPHLPEFALAAGVAIALTAVGALAGLVPFLAYPVHHSPDPTTVLPPRSVAGAAGLLAAVLFADAVLAEGVAGLAGAALGSRAPLVVAGVTLALGGPFGVLARPPSRKS